MVRYHLRLEIKEIHMKGSPRPQGMFSLSEWGHPLRYMLPQYTHSNVVFFLNSHVPIQIMQSHP